MPDWGTEDHDSDVICLAWSPGANVLSSSAAVSRGSPCLCFDAEGLVWPPQTCSADSYGFFGDLKCT